MIGAIKRRNKVPNVLFTTSKFFNLIKILYINYFNVNKKILHTLHDIH